MRKSCSCCSCSRSPATHPRPTRRGSRGRALAKRLSLPCDPPATHPEGLSRRGSRREALAPLRPTRDPPVTHPEGLSRRGSRGWGSRGQALADGLCDSPATHPRPTRRGSRGEALADGLSQRNLAEGSRGWGSRGQALADGLSQTDSHEQAHAHGLFTHILSRTDSMGSRARALADGLFTNILSRTGSRGCSVWPRFGPQRLAHPACHMSPTKKRM